VGEKAESIEARQLQGRAGVRDLRVETPTGEKCIKRNKRCRNPENTVDSESGGERTKRGVHVITVNRIPCFRYSYNSWKGNKKKEKRVIIGREKKRNHGTEDSRVVPHRGTDWAALRLTAQIERDAVLSESYGRG
jgi:hypothetical protein